MTTRKEKINEVTEIFSAKNMQYKEIVSEISKAARNYIRTILTEVKEDISVDNERYSLCVTYDGGRHPEYDANPFSQVQRIYLKNDFIYLEVEETIDYPLDNMPIGEIIDIAETLKLIIDNEFDLDD